MVRAFHDLALQHDCDIASTAVPQVRHCTTTRLLDPSHPSLPFQTPPCDSLVFVELLLYIMSSLLRSALRTAPRYSNLAFRNTRAFTTTSPNMVVHNIKSYVNLGLRRSAVANESQSRRVQGRHCRTRQGPRRLLRYLVRSL